MSLKYAPYLLIISHINIVRLIAITTAVTRAYFKSNIILKFIQQVENLQVLLNKISLRSFKEKPTDSHGGNAVAENIFNIVSVQTHQRVRLCKCFL